MQMPQVFTLVPDRRHCIQIHETIAPHYKAAECRKGGEVTASFGPKNGQTEPCVRTDENTLIDMLKVSEPSGTQGPHLHR